MFKIVVFFVIWSVIFKTCKEYNFSRVRTATKRKNAGVWGRGSTGMFNVYILQKKNFLNFVLVTFNMNSCLSTLYLFTALGLAIQRFPESGWVLNRYLNISFLYTTLVNPRLREGWRVSTSHFLVRATFCTLSRPSDIKMLVLQLFFFKMCP